MVSPTTLAPKTSAVGIPEELFLFVAGDSPGDENFIFAEDGTNEIQTE